MAKYYCTGLTADRNGTTMTFSWLLPEGKTKKTGTLQYKYVCDGKPAKKFKWNKVKLTGVTIMPTSTTITLDPSQYYPTKATTLNSIVWRVMMAGGAYTEAVYEFDKPDNIANENRLLLSKSGDTFIWEFLDDDATNNIYFQDTEYQTTNSASASTPDWAAASVSTGTGTASGSQTYSGDNSGYRHFRIRARGVNGASDWVAGYKSHTLSAKASKVSGELVGTTLNVHFDSTTEAEQALIYYVVDTPDNGFSCPAGASWTLGYTSYNVGVSNTVSMTITAPTQDQALWIRVDLYNSPNTTTGDIKEVTNGGLLNPTVSNFSVDTALKQVTFTFVNNSVVDGVYIAAFDSTGKVLGTTAGTNTTLTCDYIAADVTTVNFGIRAYWGDVDNPKAKSHDIVQGIDVTVPLPPTGLTVTKTQDEGKVQVSWTTAWTSANGTLITWSDDKDAWNSNLKPDEFEVEGSAENFLIAGLDAGKTYYFRIKSINYSNDDDVDDVYGPWNDQLVPVDLSETPDAPAVWVDNAVMAPGGSVTVNWAYVSNDGTEQQSATIYIDGTATYEINGASQIYTFTPAWNNGTSHTIAVTTLSASGKCSSTSATVTVSVVNALSLVVSTNIVSNQVTAMPITVTATGAETGGRTSVSIVRDGNYVAGRPDESTADGFSGETIYTHTFTGELSSYDIEVEDLVGRLDDGCFYKLIVTISDNLGQTATDITRFQVVWAHQPEVPTATITEVTASGIVKINVDQPSNYTAGDYFQVYRLSKDRPELIIDEGTYATDYVDPYPAAGGGYRIVNFTANGDYIGDPYPCWVDKTHALELLSVIIDFDGEQLELPYNPTLSSQWSKDFERTVYLNGAVQGDWNRAVTRDVSVGTVTIDSDDNRIELVRDLATFPGICHVRTPDGSSYAADVQVSESGEYSGPIRSFDLTIQKVDPEGFEGMTLTEWEDEQG